MRKRPFGFIVAAPSSGSGKTVLTLGIMEALRRRNLSVQPFKAGPDYIDAGLHAALLKKPSYNLDTWMMGAGPVRRTFFGKSAGADISVVEGVMGLFDGRDGKSDEGSTAHLSRLLGLPVLLVVNAEKTARSVGALIKGFESFDPRVNLRWVVFNRVGSPRHYGMLKDSLPKGSKVRVLGYLPKEASLAMPERHLGLHASSTLARLRWEGFVGKASATAEKFLDIDLLLREAAREPLRPPAKGRGHGTKATADGPLIAVALDKAFSFYYEENLDILKAFGARIVPFSPLSDKRLPEGTGGVYIGGGYPELFAALLEKNAPMRAEIKKAASGGLPIFAECGGLMYLGRSMEDMSGRVRAGVGVFPWGARMREKRAALGYREVVVEKGCPFIGKGGTLRGHEFHYSEITPPPARVRRAFKVAGGANPPVSEGYLYKNTLASYVHIHFASNPAFAKGFVEAARRTGKL